MCELYLLNLEAFIGGNTDNDGTVFRNDESLIGVGPFSLLKKASQAVTYAFDANTTKINLLKLIRAYQLNKPILIEGPPGVGKTSLVENLAKATGR